MTTKDTQLLLQSMHTLGQLIVWQTKILSGENDKRKVYKGSVLCKTETPLNKDELQSNAINTMSSHVKFMYELFEASFKE